MHNEFCRVLFSGGGPGQGPAHPPSDSVVFPDLVPNFADEKSKKELRVQKVLTRCLHLGLFIESAFFYIPCNTDDGGDAQVSLVSFLQLPYSAFPLI